MKKKIIKTKNGTFIQQEGAEYIILSDSLHSAQAQCDCACDDAVTLMPQKKTFDPDSTWQLNPDMGFWPLSDSHRVGFGASNRFSVLNNRAYRALKSTINTQDTQLTSKLVEAGLLVSDSAVETQATEATQAIASDKPQTLSAWLHITDRCNLRCDYCYLPHKKVDMSLATGQAAIDALIRSAQQQQFSKLKIKYAGGEPTLRFDTVSTLQRYAQQQSEEYGLSLDAVVLSNGTLLNKTMLADMKALGLRLMISLDGVEKSHDCQRHFAGGRGSFQQVIQGIDLALQHDIVPDISVTVSGRSAPHLHELLPFLLERDLPFSFNFYRENTYSRSQNDLQLEDDHMIQGLKTAFQVIKKNLSKVSSSYRFSHSFLVALSDRANLSAAHQRTCGVGQSYLVFQPDGHIGKCQMQPKAVLSTVDAPQPLNVIQQDRSGIQNKTVDEKEGCQECRWKYWCTGGCPLETYRVTGRYDVQSPNCRIYQAVFEDILQLEGFRLLRQHSRL